MKKLKLGFKKYLKGMFGIFMIKLCIVGLIVINQSCETEGELDYTNEQIVAKELFSEAMNESFENMHKVEVIPNNNTISRRIKSDIVTIRVFKNSKKITKSSRSQTMNSLGDIISSGYDYEIVGLHKTLGTGGTGEITDDGNLYFDIELEEVNKAIKPVINASKNYLYAYDFSDEEISEVLIGQDESLLVPMVEAAIKVDNQNKMISYHESNKLTDFLFGIESANAQLTWSEVGTCAAAAIGIDVLQDMKEATAGKKMSKKILKKAFKKVAAKFVSYLTGWGLAWTGVYFIGCLGASALS